MKQSHIIPLFEDFDLEEVSAATQQAEIQQAEADIKIEPEMDDAIDKVINDEQIKVNNFIDKNLKPFAIEFVAKLFKKNKYNIDFNKILKYAKSWADEFFNTDCIPFVYTEWQDAFSIWLDDEAELAYEKTQNI